MVKIKFVDLQFSDADFQELSDEDMESIVGGDASASLFNGVEGTLATAGNVLEGTLGTAGNVLEGTLGTTLNGLRRN